MEKDAKILILGSSGMVGSAFVRELSKRGYKNLLTPSHKELDLLDDDQVYSYFKYKKPDYVILAAALVGGIKMNMLHNAEFLLVNSTIQNNVISECNYNKVKKLVMLGSSCIYPKDCKQPMKEEYLMTGQLEPTNEGYALAKISGIKLAQFYNKEYGLQILCPMPCNLYGKNDNFDLENCHVLSALVRRFVDAKDAKLPYVTLWGTGIARREFLNVDDAVRAILLAMDTWNSPDIINIGDTIDISIKDLAKIVAQEVKYKGEIRWDPSMPDGMLFKKLDTTNITNLGFKPRIYLRDGIRELVKEYRKQYPK